MGIEKKKRKKKIVKLIAEKQENLYRNGILEFAHFCHC